MRGLRCYVPSRRLRHVDYVDLNTIPLTKGFVATIDPEDTARARKHLWCAMVVGGKVYAARRPGTGRARRWVFLHRWLIDAPDGMDVDHINGDPLDNRKCNLRLATRSQNTANSTVSKGKVPLRGVCFDKHGKFRAEITARGAKKHLGTFETAEGAHAAYCEARQRLFGEYAPQD